MFKKFFLFFLRPLQLSQDNSNLILWVVFCSLLALIVQAIRMF